MNIFSEDNLIEQTVIKLVADLWQDKGSSINAFSDEADMVLGRDNRGQVVLEKHLLTVLKEINPNIPPEFLSQAIEELVRDRSILSLVNANHEIYKLLRDGVSVKVEDDLMRVKFFDFDNPESNHFLCVSQLWVTGDMYTRRPDVIIYVNGIPLLLLELKASHKSLVDAYRDNIRDYKDTIPKLFWYNLGIIISNGIESKFGSLTSPFEYFNEWKKVSDEDESPKTDLATIIAGICDKKRLLDIFENFILFDNSKSETKKIVPRYFQYLGVNRAYGNVLIRNELDGKLGVFWHTQGSGKSYSMVYLSQKVMRKVSGNFTFVIVTDRKDLDKQAYENFEHVSAVYESEVRADSIKHLASLLQQDHRQIFTTIYKFADNFENISDRSDVIVMTDEAHRSQYDVFAQNMRKALPKASFIGFTGTPLMSEGEEKTRETFGDYISTYNFGDSVRDGATVPLYYENRVPALDNVNTNLEVEVGKVMEYYSLNEEDEEKLEQEFSTFYHLITREDRLNAVARDIVEHFIGRGYNGKAMVVSVDKKTAIRMFAKVRAEWDRYMGKLRLDLSRATDDHEKEKIERILELHENVDMVVMVSQGQNEIADMEELEIDMKSIRQRIQNEDLEAKFKKADSNLRIVFVCAMWLTGFDVPNLSTLYLDKPLKNHTLMQTIARANRVAEGKTHGLIVDYIGVFKNIQKALAIYASTGNEDDEIIRSKEQLVGELKEVIKLSREFLISEGLNLDSLLVGDPQMRLSTIESYTNSILGSKNKKQFLNLASAVQSAYQSVLPDPTAEKYYQECTAIKVLASRIRDVGNVSHDFSQIKKDLEDLLDKSIHAGTYTVPHYKKVKDLSLLDANKLHDFFKSLKNQDNQIDSLFSELGQKIEGMIKKNKQRAHFMDRLKELLSQYNSGAHDIDQVFDDLIELAKDLSTEEQRSIKEGLSEEELAIFDLLKKDGLNPSEVDQIKKVAKDLLEKLKNTKLVLDWREREPLRSGVKDTILTTLYSSLPYPKYSEEECDSKMFAVYNHVYEQYRGFHKNI